MDAQSDESNKIFSNTFWRLDLLLFVLLSTVSYKNIYLSHLLARIDLWINANIVSDRQQSTTHHNE
jgi:hypothetical protein